MCLDTLVQFMILCRHRAYRKAVNPVSVMFFVRCFDSSFRLYYYRSSEKRLLLEVYGKDFFHDERGRTESIFKQIGSKKRRIVARWKQYATKRNMGILCTMWGVGSNANKKNQQLNTAFPNKEVHCISMWWKIQKFPKLDRQWELEASY